MAEARSVMEELRRISLRVDEDLFQQLNDRRGRERTSFQEVGERLFREWLAGERESSSMPEFGALSREEWRLLRAVLRYYRDGPSEDLFRQALIMLAKGPWGKER